MKKVLFEDDGFQNLLPIAYFRPVWELRSGVWSNLERFSQTFTSEKIYFYARTYLMESYLPEDRLYDISESSEALFLNGRWLTGSSLKGQIDSMTENSVLVSGQDVLAFRISGKSPKNYFRDGLLLSDNILNDLKAITSEEELMHYPWNFIDRNGSQISEDFNNAHSGGAILGQTDNGCHLMNRENIFIDEGARVMPGVVINAEEGPVWLGKGCRVMPNSVLEGPLYIGDKSLIKIGAKIYENTSIGKVCKVGGEVEESIIQEFSNKQHDGFLGHSYLGAWINLGADTNNSDLKNNYGEISIYLNNRSIETGKRFLGTLMGDHTKTSINTQLNTGTVIGVNCNIFGEGFPPKFIPSFSWGGAAGFSEYKFEKCIQVAKTVMERRKVAFGDREKNLFQAVKKLSSSLEKSDRK